MVFLILLVPLCEEGGARITLGQAKCHLVLALQIDPKEFRGFLLTPVPAAGYSIAIIAAILEFWLWHAVGMLRFLAQTGRILCSS